MSNLLQELEAKIDGLANSTVTKSNVGTVREIGDGVARIEGLAGVMLNEMLEFPGGIYGLALTLVHILVEPVVSDADGAGHLGGVEKVRRIPIAEP